MSSRPGRSSTRGPWAAETQRPARWFPVSGEDPSGIGGPLANPAITSDQVIGSGAAFPPAPRYGVPCAWMAFAASGHRPGCRPRECSPAPVLGAIGVAAMKQFDVRCPASVIGDEDVRGLLGGNGAPVRRAGRCEKSLTWAFSCRAAAVTWPPWCLAAPSPATVEPDEIVCSTTLGPGHAPRPCPRGARSAAASTASSNAAAPTAASTPRSTRPPAVSPAGGAAGIRNSRGSTRPRGCWPAVRPSTVPGGRCPG